MTEFAALRAKTQLSDKNEENTKANGTKRVPNNDKRIIKN